MVRKQHQDILSKVRRRKEGGENNLNYQSVKPYEKNLRDKSPLPPGEKKKTGSFIKSQRRNQSVITPQEGDSSHVLPLVGEKPKPKKVVSRKSTSRQPAPDQLSTSSSRVPDQYKEVVEKLGEPHSYFGPINLEALWRADPKSLFLSILESLHSSGITILKVGNYKIDCALQKHSFQLELSQMDLFPGHYLLRFYRNKISSSEAQTVSQKITDLIQQRLDSN